MRIAQRLSPLPDSVGAAPKPTSAANEGVGSRPVVAAVRALLVALGLALAAVAAPAQGLPAAGSAEAQACLQQARLAYRDAGAFRETLDLTLTLPNGRQERRRTEYGVDPAGSVFLALSHGEGEIFRIVAASGRMVATQLNVAQHYAEVPYAGDFAAALRALGGDREQLVAPPGLVARQGGGPEELLAAFRLGVLAPLVLSGYRPAGVGGGEGAAGVQLDFQAANGRLVVELDPSCHRLRRIEGQLGEGAQQVRAAGPFSFAVWGNQAAVVVPDPAGRTAVPTLAALNEVVFPLGQPAPKVVLPSLTGEPVHLGELAGTVVVIDFWATWCVPCWTALAHTAELAAWARDSGLPVRVFAVDTLETDTTDEALRQRSMELLRAKKIEVPVLLDNGGLAFAAFHNPGLPSLVIIGPDGRFASYHSGLLPDMVGTVREEIRQLLRGTEKK